jgi:methyl-accepting chemotaxis protein
MLTRLTIRSQVLIIVSAFCVLLLTTGVLGLLGMQRGAEGLRSMYEDRVVPLGQIAAVTEVYVSTVPDAARRAHAGGMTPEAGAQQIDAGLKNAESNWKAYLATTLVVEEQVLIDQIKPLLVKVDAAARALMLALAGQTTARDPAVRDALVRDGARAAADVATAAEPLLSKLKDLSAVQLVVAKQQYLEAESAYRTALFVVIALCTVGLLFGVFAGSMLVRGILKPVVTAEHLATRIAQGNLSVDVVASGGGEVGKLLAALSKMQLNLRGTVTRIRAAADNVATAATQIAAGNTDLADRTEKQASTLQAAASSTQQLASVVQQNSGAAREADGIAQLASEAAACGGMKVSQVVVTINAIERGIGKMAEITDVIDGIAFQTNILALNAAVEAARAGDKGRGFAVVAAEVRALAKRSADAAKEIAALITSNVREVKEGASLARETGSTIADVVGQVKRVSEYVAQITAANREQASGITQVNTTVGVLDQMTQQNAALVEEGAAAAESLRVQAFQLTEAVSAFRLDDTEQLGRSSGVTQNGGSHESSAVADASPATGATKLSEPSSMRPLATGALQGIVGATAPLSAEWERF